MVIKTIKANFLKLNFMGIEFTFGFEKKLQNPKAFLKKEAPLWLFLDTIIFIKYLASGFDL